MVKDFIIPGHLIVENNATITGIGDTQATILASTPVTGKLKYGSDTKKWYLADGTNWREISLQFNIKQAAPDRGAITESSLDGVHKDYIADKGIFNCYIGDNQLTTDGAIKNVAGVLSIYNTTTASYELIVKNFVLVEDTGTGRMLLAHAPVTYDEYLSVENEDSFDNLAGNGLPVFQGGMADRGPNPYPQVIDGGTF